MKKLFILSSSILIITFTSCKKNYICVCTERSTGEKSYGEHFKAGPLLKKAAQESCEANDDVFANDLEDCHLE